MVALFVAACGGDGDDAAFDQRAGRGRGTTTTDGSTTTGEATTTTTVAAAAGTATTRRSTTARPNATGRPPAGTTATPSGPPPNVRLTQIASLDQPLDLTGRPGEANALYVAEQGGRVRVIRNGAVQPGAVFDLSGEVSTGGEQGLLGMAFNASGSHLYVNITDRAGDTRILELAMAGGARRQLGPTIDQPYANHNGGGLAFGADGRLYIALGDGGSGGDPQGNAQNLSSPLGKLLRMNVADGSYVVHDYGLRNPFRFSIDRPTGDIWIGDVGQDGWEEVSVDAGGAGGRNFGWDRMEGNHVVEGSAPGNHTGPVYEYSHSSGGCVITGGYVYRGNRIAGLGGTYVFIDVCIGQLWGFRSGARTNLGPKAEQIVSFGQDNNGELYALSLNGPVYRIDPA